MKRHATAIVLAVTALGVFLTGTVQAQTKITQPAAGLPYKITKSGSYFLGANLAVSNRKTTAILVKVSNVTISLNGFTISGLGGNSTGIGIDASAATGVIIAGGTISGFGTGVALNSNSTVQNVQVLGNGVNGITVSGSSCIVSNSLISGNGGTGLNFSDSTSGYLNNVINNSSNVLNGTNMGGNVCSGTLCP